MATTYINRTAGTPTSQKKCTISFWLKMAKVTADMHIFDTYTDASNRSHIQLDTADKCDIRFRVGNTNIGRLVTTRVFRDPSAWMHIIVALDTTQSTEADRIKLYINGTQETSFTTATYPSVNADVNLSGTHTIGAYGGGGNYFDGLLSHVHFSDGYAYPASTFGSTDATTGEWEINTSPSFTLGTNGFTILKDGNTITDQSSNSNNFTLGGGTLTNTEDCPSNNFATLSTIYQPKESGNAAMTNGNLRHGGSGDYSGCAGIGMKTGKYYWEIKIAAGGSQRNIGIVRADKIHSNTTYGFYLAQGGAGSLTTEYSAGYRASDGDFVVKSTGSQTITSASTTTTTGDIVGVAVDCDNYTIQFFKNGVSMQTLNLTSAFFDVEQLPADRTDDGTYFEYNFGNGFFGTTAISSEGTNASGIGKFEYDVPTGFTALSTKGLNE